MTPREPSSIKDVRARGHTKDPQTEVALRNPYKTIFYYEQRKRQKEMGIEGVTCEAGGILENFLLAE